MIPPRETLVDMLTREISARIVEGVLPPGSRLDEASLATAFGVSRTPIREALGQLSASGLLERRPHRGVVVATVTQDRLLHLFELMTELEGMCARLAAERMGPALREQLASLHDQCQRAVAADDLDTYARLNRAFHFTIYDGAQNPAMVQTTRGIRTRLAPFRLAQFRLAGRLALSYSEHDVVVRAIQARDGETAARAMSAHLGIVRDAYRSIAAVADLATPLVRRGGAVAAAAPQVAAHEISEL